MSDRLRSRDFSSSGSRSRSRSNDRRSRSNDRLEGVVLRINDRGFGFARRLDTEEEIFFHTNHIQNSNLDIRRLRPNDRIEFTTVPSNKKPGKEEAEKVWVCDPDTAYAREEMRPSKRRSRSRSRRRYRSRSRSRSRSRGRRRRSRSRSRGRRRRRSRSRSDSRRRNRRYEGEVLRINERGFGFCRPHDSDEEIFFHARHIQNRGIDIRQLRAGDRIEFCTVKSEKFDSKDECNMVWVLSDDAFDREQNGRRPSPRR